MAVVSLLLICCSLWTLVSPLEDEGPYAQPSGEQQHIPDQPLSEVDAILGNGYSPEESYKPTETPNAYEKASTITEQENYPTTSEYKKAEYEPDRRVPTSPEKKPHEEKSPYEETPEEQYETRPLYTSSVKSTDPPYVVESTTQPSYSSPTSPNYIEHEYEKQDEPYQDKPEEDSDSNPDNLYGYNEDKITQEIEELQKKLAGLQADIEKVLRSETEEYGEERQSSKRGSSAEKVHYETQNTRVPTKQDDQ